MSTLRFPFYALCWILTCSLVQANDQSFWKNPISLAYRRNRMELLRTEHEMTQQGLPPTRTFASRAYETYRKRTLEDLPDRENFDSQQLSPSDWSSLSKPGGDSLLDERDESEWLAVDNADVDNPMLTLNFLEGDGSRAKRETAEGSGDNARLNFQERPSSNGQVSFRSYPTKIPRQLHQKVERESWPSYHAHVLPPGFLFGLFSPYVHGKPQLTSSRMVSTSGLSRSHRSGRLQEDALVLCRKSSLPCFRRRAVALKRYRPASQRKRTEFRSPYLLGGALGRR